MVRDWLSKQVVQDRFVRRSLKERQDGFLIQVSLTMAILSFVFLIYQLLLTKNHEFERNVTIIITCHATVSYLLLQNYPSKFSNSFFITGYFLIAFAMGFFGDIFYFYIIPSFYPFIVLFTFIFGIIGLITSFVISISLLITIILLSINGTFGISAPRELNYPQYFLGEILILLFFGTIMAVYNYHRVRLVHDINEAKNRYESIMESTPDAIFVLDQNYIIREMNTRFEELTGYKREELLGSKIVDLIAQQNLDEFLLYTEELVCTGQATYRSVFMNLRRELIHFEIRGTKLQENTYLHLLRDITQETTSDYKIKELERNISKLQRIEIIHKIAGNVSHNFNNLFTSLLGFTEIGLSEHDLEGKDKMLEHIKEQILKGEVLTKKLSSFTQHEMTEPVYFLIDEKIRELNSTFKRLIGIGNPINLNLNAPKAFIYMDINNFEHILLNLIMNSKEASLVGDKIEISTYSSDYLNPLDLHIEMMLEDSMNVVEIIVKDEGIGFRGDEDRMFDAFYSTKTQGSGMGLYIVKQIIEANDGYIDIGTSEHGTTVAIYLPYTFEEKKTFERKRFHDLSIIFIESYVTELLITFLEANGNNITTTNNQEAAIKLINNSNYDLIVIGSNSMNSSGSNLVKIEEFTKYKIPIILLIEEDYQMEYENLASEEIQILTKPFSYNEFTNSVHKLITYKK